MDKEMLWYVLIQYILPRILIGLGILALVLIILTVIYIVNTIKDWIEDYSNWRKQ